MSEKDKAPEQEPIKIKDKRKFDEKGDLRQDCANEEKAEPQHAPAQAQEEAPGEQAAPEGKKGGEPFPPITFAAFMLSLSTMAMVYLGQIPNPESNKVEKNLALAKHHIDILGLLQEKTKGNLDAEEEKLLQNLLYDLRMQYVSLAR